MRGEQEAETRRTPPARSRRTWIRSLAACAAIGLLAASCASEKPLAADSPALRGWRLAAHNCVGCHNAGRAGASVLAGAPPFRTLPADPDLIRTAVQNAASHPPNSMPEIPLSTAQILDITAYIESLRSDDPAGRLPDLPNCFMRTC